MKSGAARQQAQQLTGPNGDPVRQPGLSGRGFIPPGANAAFQPVPVILDI